jgi:hypothetical protein
LGALLVHFKLKNLKGDFFILFLNVRYIVTKSEPNEASLWKITLQKRENSHVDAGTFIPPLTRFLYIIL